MTQNPQEKEIKSLSQTLKAFREKFGDEKEMCCCGREYCYPGSQENNIIRPFEVFLTQSIKSACEEMIVEERKRKMENNIGDCISCGFTFRNCQCDGYNLSRQDQLERLKNILG